MLARCLGTCTSAAVVLAACSACSLDESGIASNDASADVVAVDVTGVDVQDSGIDDAPADTIGADVPEQPDVVPAAPGDLSDAGLALWLRDGVVTADSGTGAVVAWLDQSGNGNDLTSAGSGTATLVSSDPAFASKPSVAFGAGSNLLRDTAFTLTSQPATFFAVFNSSPGATLYNILVDSSGTGSSRMGLFIAPATGNLTLFTGQTSSFWDSGRPVSAPNSTIAIFDGPASLVYVSQNQATGGASLDSASSLSGIEVGSQPGGGGLNGHLAELAIWSTALPAQSVARLNAYASTRYAVVISP